MRNVKRLGLFHFYDKEGIVGDHVTFLLDDVMENLSHLVITCNGHLSEQGFEKFRKYTDDIFIQENSAFDAESFKETLTSLYGWENIYMFDELVLINNSFYGPLYPFKRVFGEMDARHVDFWGITAHAEVYNRCRFHLQSYFIVIREKLLKSRDFRRFWEAMGRIDSKKKVARLYEFEMTGYFTDLGYICGVYTDNSPLVSDNTKNNYDCLCIDAHDMIRKYNCPIVKRKIFSLEKREILNASSGDEARRVLRYIDRHTEYDVNIVWDDIIRRNNVSDIISNLGLYYILPADVKNTAQNVTEGKKIAIIAHMYYADLIDECFEYIRNIPSGIDVYITTNGENAAEITKHAGNLNIKGIIPVENRGRDISALLVGCRDIFMKYDYLCFTHDKKTARDREIPKTGKAFMRILWENTLSSPEYIENVIHEFDKNSRLGLLGVPSPYHSVFFSHIGGRWTNCLEVTNTLAHKLGLSTKLSADTEPLLVGTAFWCRTAALKTLFDHGFNYCDFPQEPVKFDGTIMHAIERIFPYVAQHEGYISGIVMTTDYAAVQSSDYYDMLSGIVRVAKKNYPVYTYYYFLKAKAIVNSLILFCNNHPMIYVYGMGTYADLCFDMIIRNSMELKGVVVSDGQPKQETFRGYKVCYLSEIPPPREDIGIVAALGYENSEEVVPMLRKKGYKVFRLFKKLECEEGI